MNGAVASIGLLALGWLIVCVCMALDRPKTALVIGGLFAAPALVRLWIAAVAS